VRRGSVAGVSQITKKAKSRSKRERRILKQPERNMSKEDQVRDVEMIINTDGEDAKSVRVCAAVLKLVDRGRDHLRAWESIKSIVDSDVWLADLAMPFFAVTAVAHVEAAAINAAKLTDTHGDSINVSYLFNIIESERHHVLLRNDWPRLKDVIAAGRVRIQGIAKTVTRIKEKRDRDLAHLDKRQLDATYESQAIEVADLCQVFDAIDEIARELARTSPAFADIQRFSVGAGTTGTEWIEDSVYFARAGFHDESVRSPNQRSERVREWDRALRAATATLDGSPDGGSFSSRTG
jgi:hypothetical protein